MLLKIKEKWNIGVIDLWNDSDMKKITLQDYNKYMKDPVHPNKLGYREWWGPKFVDKLNNVLSK